MPVDPTCDTLGVGNVVRLFSASSARLLFDDGEQYTAGELVDEGCRLAAWLGRQGFEGGDRIAIRMPNGAAYIRLLIACAAGGFVAVPVNTRYSDAEAIKAGHPAYTIE